MKDGQIILYIGIQRAQNPLSKEYTLNDTAIPDMM